MTTAHDHPLDGTPDDLIRALCDERATNADRRRLAEMMKSDPALRSRFIDMMVMDAMLRFDHAAELMSDSEPDEPMVLATIKPTRRAPWVAAAALLLGIGITIAIIVFAVSPQPQPAPLGPACAVLSEAPHAIWREAPEVPRVGDRLTAGRYELVAGSAQLDFLDGTEVRIDEGAVVELIGPDQMSLFAGNLIARVAPGRSGFRVNAPGVSVVDLGTEFGVSVNANGISRVVVFDGLVEGLVANPDGGEPSRVRIGRYGAKSFDANSGAVVDIPFEVSGFAMIGGQSARFGDWIEKPRPDDAIDFTDAQPIRVPTQDGQHGFVADLNVLDDGRTIHLRGNAWKAIEHTYEFTPNTVLAFEYRHDRGGELAGINFLGGPQGSGDAVAGAFLVEYIEATAGSERMHREYAGYEGPGWAHFEIPVGKHLTGERDRIVFVADDDADGASSVYFRDVRLYEAEPDSSAQPNESVPTEPNAENGDDDKESDPDRTKETS